MSNCGRLITKCMMQPQSALPTSQVLCDQLGVGCSLVRGEYGRHWNEVTLLLEEEGAPQTFTVDLMFEPGRLMPSGSPDTKQYQHI